jgi:hypothetical protein
MLTLSFGETRRRRMLVHHDFVRAVGVLRSISPLFLPFFRMAL